ncbi:hypothetical protein NEOLEDRAFT_84228 [Neolentinus lepideus HHB14362 ss-1]|uniref:Cupin type-2 domain-containing protein n=1 Tax=Neolentinus lepideus HHB14362 ss-1 TaxID=1314782 RepID=A0A165MYB2_9AGAM|nr:hypothetical protein NEOLEDRAFT_84228 [Neolentinus lepideus HHB14362 ss-1]
MSSSSSSSENAYMLRASNLSLKRQSHPMNTIKRREQLSLGDHLGLTKCGIHLCHLPPGNESTELHWHTNDDEWIYILKAGPGAVMRIKQGEGLIEEYPLREGDFYGFAASSRIAHAVKTDTSEVLYLLGGSRTNLDSSHYPQLDKRRITDRTGRTKGWVVDDGETIDLIDSS